MANRRTPILGWKKLKSWAVANVNPAYAAAEINQPDNARSPIADSTARRAHKAPRIIHFRCIRNNFKNGFNPCDPFGKVTTSIEGFRCQVSGVSVQELICRKFGSV